nr:GTP cyclohydrolase I FolE [Coxiella endosymbiont of Amblyomma nuttalli]
MNDVLEKNIQTLFASLGENPDREGLKKTPKRFLGMLKHLTKGYQESLDTLINEAIYQSDMDEMVIVKNIEVYSLCEHHLLPFFGKCHVAYLPNKKIIGISKLGRIVDMFAKRLQVQEHLTKQIAESILTVTKAKGVGVIIEAKHLCMIMRGVQKKNSDMKTSMMLGMFRKDDRTRSEFLSLLRC